METKNFKKKTPGDLGPVDDTVHTREDRPTVQLCGDSNVACKWINEEFAQGTKYKNTLGNSKNLALMQPHRSPTSITPRSTSTGT